MEAARYEALRERNHIAELQGLLDDGIGIVGTTRDDMVNGPDGIYMAYLLPPEALKMEVKSIGNPIDSFELEAADSHHEVEFSNVSFVTAAGEETEVMVAVKHYDDELESAGIECEALLEMQHRGFDALAPVAVVKNGTDSYLFTLLRPDIRSMDNNDWTPRPDEPGFEKLTENLSFIANSLASLHAAGIFHGDAQPKNFARSDTGEYVVIDLEKGCQVTMDEEHHIVAYNGLYETEASDAYGDLKTLWMTLNRQIGGNENNKFLGGDAPYQEMYDVFKAHFVHPYMDKLEAAMEPDAFAKLEVAKVIEHLDIYVRRSMGL